MERLREIHSSIREELRGALPDDLYQELDRLTPELRDGSKDEMELAHASLLGWLTGLFQGTQVALQLQAGAGGRQPLRRPPQPSSEEQDEGTYL